MSKPSPLKGADPVLVKGAYDAAGNQVYQAYVQATHDRLMQIGDEVAKWDFGTGAQRILQNGGKLPQAEINGARALASGPMKEEYMKGDQGKKEEVEAEARAMKAGMDQYKELRLNLATAYTNDQLSNGFMRTSEGEDVMMIMQNKARLSRKTCPPGVEDCDNKNEIGIMMKDYQKIADANAAMARSKAKLKNLEQLDQQGLLYLPEGQIMDQMTALQTEIDGYQELLDSNPVKWTSINSVQSMIKLKDQKSKDNLSATRKAIYDRAFNSHPDDNITFREEKAREAVQNGILSIGDKDSLIYDPMFGNKSFYENMISHIVGEGEGGRTYRDFGVTEQMMLAGDLDFDGKISLEEGENIAQAIVSNEDLVGKELEDYFVQHLKSNHDEALLAKQDILGGNEQFDNINDGVIGNTTTEDKTSLNSDHFDENGHFNLQPEENTESDDGDDDDGDDVGDLIEDDNTVA